MPCKSLAMQTKQKPEATILGRPPWWKRDSQKQHVFFVLTIGQLKSTGTGFRPVTIVLAQICLLLEPHQRSPSCSAENPHHLSWRYMKTTCSPKGLTLRTDHVQLQWTQGRISDMTKDDGCGFRPSQVPRLACWLWQFSGPCLNCCFSFLPPGWNFLSDSLAREQTEFEQLNIFMTGFFFLVFFSAWSELLKEIKLTSL